MVEQEKEGQKELSHLALIRLVFRHTLPVLMGYLSIGMAFGLMLDGIGYGVWWSALMSVTIYAGSGQYLGVGLLAMGASLVQVAMMTLILNLRHMVYGLSFLEKYRGMGWRKWYMIFALTDETYALLASAVIPEGVSPRRYYFTVSLMNHSYWIAGSLIGSLMGALLTIDSTGVDFAMTALFLVIAVEQWKGGGSHAPAFLGGGVTLVSLLLLGVDNMLIPALLAMVGGLLLMRRKLEPTSTAQEGTT